MFTRHHTEEQVPGLHVFNSSAWALRLADKALFEVWPKRAPGTGNVHVAAEILLRAAATDPLAKPSEWVASGLTRIPETWPAEQVVLACGALRRVADFASTRLEKIGARRDV